MNELFFIAICVVGGIFAGLSSGLMGLGGGLVIVPILNFILPWIYPDIKQDYVLPIAIQTSFTLVFINTLTTFFHQRRLNNVNPRIVFSMAPALMISVFLVGQIVTKINPGYLKIFFAIVIFGLAVNMFRRRRSEDDIDPLSWGNVTPRKGAVAGAIIGGISATAGIGGGGLLVMFFHACKVPIKRALGTTSACSCLVAISGMISYFITGYGVHTGIPYTYGYFSLIAFASFFLTIILFASVGVKLQTVLPAQKVKKMFAIYTMFISIDIAYSGFHILHLSLL